MPRLYRQCGKKPSRKPILNIENQEWAVYLKTLLPDSPVEEKPNVYRLGWCADYPDSNNWLNEVFNSKSGQNYATYNNPEYDALVEEAAIEPDPEKRLELYKQAEEIFINEDTAIAPYLLLHLRTYVQTVGRPRLSARLAATPLPNGLLIGKPNKPRAVNSFHLSC